MNNNALKFEGNLLVAPISMNWYYKIQGIHVHVRVFMNGGKCGDLCFRISEFEQIRASNPSIITFFKEE